TFQPSECAWIVSPFVIDTSFSYMQCVTDEYGLVTMTYNPEGGLPVEGCANYLIVGIRGNNIVPDLEPIPSPTPPPSPTPTPSPTRTMTPVVSPTPSVTPTPGVSPTPTVTVTPTTSVTPSVTPSASPITYVLSLSSSQSGSVLPGSNICYTVSLNYPAPGAGYPVTLTRSGDLSSVCVSTDGTAVGPVLE